MSPKKSASIIDGKEPQFDSNSGILEAILNLLGRLVYPPELLPTIITKYKRNPEKYIKAYNLCDGEHTVTKIAEIIGIDPSTISVIFTDWKDLGIIYEINKKGGKFYKNLYKVEEKMEKIPQEEKAEPKVKETEIKP